MTTNIRTIYILNVKLKDGSHAFVYSTDPKADDGYNYLNLVTSDDFIMKSSISGRIKRVKSIKVDLYEKDWYLHLDTKMFEED